MPVIVSRHWNYELGVCEKHHIHKTPCPQCIRERDPDIELVIGEEERISISINEDDGPVWNYNEEVSLQNIMDEYGDWLIERVVE